MNEPGLPGSAPPNLPTATPPSYLRTPQNTPPRGLSIALLTTASLFAIIGIGLLFQTFSPFDFSPNTKIALNGSLVFAVQKPTAGIYAYDFATKEVNQIDTGIASKAEALQWTSFSSSGGFYVQHYINNERDTPQLVVGNLSSDQKYRTGSSDAGARFDFPIVSNDGTHIAFTRLAFLVTAKTKAELKNGQGKRTPQISLAYASLANDVFTMHTLDVEGSPLVFSPDNTRLIIRQTDKLSLVTLIDSKSTVIDGTPPLKSFISNVAFSKSGKEIAFAVDGSIYWGPLDSATGIFKSIIVLKAEADSISLSDTGELLYSNREGLHSYRLMDQKKSTIATPKEFVGGAQFITISR